MLLRRFRSAGASCRRIFTRFDKLDATFLSFLDFALAVEMIFDLAWTGPSLCLAENYNALNFRL